MAWGSQPASQPGSQAASRPASQPVSMHCGPTSFLSREGNAVGPHSCTTTTTTTTAAATTTTTTTILYYLFALPFCIFFSFPLDVNSKKDFGKRRFRFPLILFGSYVDGASHSMGHPNLWGIQLHGPSHSMGYSNLRAFPLSGAFNDIL